MREIKRENVVTEVSRLCLEANYQLSNSMFKALESALATEESELGRTVLSTIIENDTIAKNENRPMCQDTGMVVVFLEIGNKLLIDFDLYEAINEGVRLGYKTGYLRNSVVGHPINRINTNDNTPAIIHTKFVIGDKLTIKLAAKGAGSENMSRHAMLRPADGLEGIKKFVLDTVRNAKGNPCPPIIVGVGVGGNFEQSALYAKEAIFRDVYDNSDDEIARNLENDLLVEINKTGIGPMGFGGTNTCLAVKVIMGPTHIASLPVAVNIQCHASRKVKAVL